MRARGLGFALQLAFALLVCAFLVVPIVMSILAGFTDNYLSGVKGGLTLRWVARVWEGYRDTVFLSIGIALGCLAVTLVLGVPAAYALARRQSWLTRTIEELLVMPVAIPGLATALALIVTYGTVGGFRTSWLSPSSLATCSSPCRSWCEPCWRSCLPSICAPSRKARPVSVRAPASGSSASCSPTAVAESWPAR